MSAPDRPACVAGCWLLAMCLALAALPLRADQVIADDLIVQGSLCAGLDCVNDLDFAGDTLRLRENNTRIRLHDTTAPAEPGQSWTVEANEATNGGSSEFNIGSKGLVVISDGTAIWWDCSSGMPVNVGVIPAGQVAIDPDECGTLYTHPHRPMLRLDVVGDNAVALGEGSEFETGTISLGSAEVKHRLANVAAGLAQSDALILGLMNGYGPLNQWTEQIGELSAQLDAIEAILDELEDSGGGGGSSLLGTGPALLLGLGLALALAATRRRKLRRAAANSANH